MSILFADCETFSKLDVTEVGAYKYARHESTVPILWSFIHNSWPHAVVTEQPNIWEQIERLRKTKQIPEGTLTVAHWNDFDRLIAQEQVLGMFKPHADLPGFVGPLDTLWIDMRPLSLAYGGPGGAEQAAKFWGGEVFKTPGKALIDMFCKPNADGGRNDMRFFPEEWTEYREYSRRDSEILRPIWDSLERVGPWGHSVKDHATRYHLVERMNERGVEIDVDCAEIVNESLKEQELVLANKMIAKYGFKPTQIQKVQEFLGTPNCQAITLEEFIAEHEDDPAKEDEVEVANTRLMTGGAARRKLGPMLHYSKGDGRLRGAWTYHGAWTSRMTSLGPQLHNMYMHKSDPAFFDSVRDGSFEGSLFEETRNNIRGFIRASEGHIFVAADFKQVELRVGAWLAGEDSLTRKFENGDDVYVEQAAQQLGKKADDVTADERQFPGKTIELASLFQLGWYGLLTQLDGKRLRLPGADDWLGGLLYRSGFTIQKLAEEFQYKKIFDKLGARALTDIDLLAKALACNDAINKYRTKRTKIVAAWKRLDEMFKGLVEAKNGTVRYYRNMYMVRCPEFIKCVRPSGYCHYYMNPRLVDGAWPDGKPRKEIRYDGRGEGGVMMRKHTYGGDIYQSYVQGTAADVMYEAMWNCERLGFRPVMAIHDELVNEPWIASRAFDYDELLQSVCEAVEVVPEWAEGLPLEAEGWVGEEFTK